MATKDPQRSTTSVTTSSSSYNVCVCVSLSLLYGMFKIQSKIFPFLNRELLTHFYGTCPSIICTTHIVFQISLTHWVKFEPILFSASKNMKYEQYKNFKSFKCHHHHIGLSLWIKTKSSKKNFIGIF